MQIIVLLLVYLEIKIANQIKLQSEQYFQLNTDCIVLKFKYAGKDADNAPKNKTVACAHPAIVIEQVVNISNIQYSYYDCHCFAKKRVLGKLLK